MEKIDEDTWGSYGKWEQRIMLRNKINEIVDRINDKKDRYDWKYAATVISALYLKCPCGRTHKVSFDHAGSISAEIDTKEV